MSETDSTLRSSCTSLRTSCNSQTLNSSISSSIRHEQQLEQLALEFQRQLLTQGLVGQHTTVMVSVPNTFTGADAVSILQLLMPRRTTREEALAKGEEIKETFSFFKHAIKPELPLLDSPADLFQFQNNLPSQVQKMKKKYRTYWDRACLLEQHLPVKTRKQLFKTLRNSFVAEEAIDVMMDLKIVKSRREGVYLMNKLNEKVSFCEPTTPGQEFKDEHIYFTLIPSSQRIQDPHHKKDQKKSASRDRAQSSSSDPISQRDSSHTQCTQSSHQSSESEQQLPKRRSSRKTTSSTQSQDKDKVSTAKSCRAQ